MSAGNSSKPFELERLTIPQLANTTHKIGIQSIYKHSDPYAEGHRKITKTETKDDPWQDEFGPETPEQIIFKRKPVFVYSEAMKDKYGLEKGDTFMTDKDTYKIIGISYAKRSSHHDQNPEILFVKNSQEEYDYFDGINELAAAKASPKSECFSFFKPEMTCKNPENHKLLFQVSKVVRMLQNTEASFKKVSFTLDVDELDPTVTKKLKTTNNNNEK